MAETIDGFDAESARALQTADLTLQLAPVLARQDHGSWIWIESIARSNCRWSRSSSTWSASAFASIWRRCDKAGREMEKELARLTEEIYKLAGEEFNINSPAQLGDIFEKLNFEVGRKTKTGKISTSADVLEELAIEVRAASEDHRVSRDREAEKHLRRCASEADRSANRPRAHDFESSRVGYRAIVVDESQSSKHSDQVRAWPANSRGVRRIAGIQVDVGRLFADRAASVRAHNQRSGDDRSLQTRRRHSRAHCARCIRREDETGRVRCAPACKDRQLRDPLRDRSVRSGAAHRA